MASSSNPRSSSSGSKQPKPTYRKAKGGTRSASRPAPAAPQPEPEPARKQAASYAVPSTRKRPGQVSAPASGARSPQAAQPARKQAAPRGAQATRTVKPASKPAAQQQSQRASQQRSRAAAPSQQAGARPPASATSTARRGAAPASASAPSSARPKGRVGGGRQQGGSRSARPRSYQNVPPTSDGSRRQRGEGGARLFSNVHIPRPSMGRLPLVLGGIAAVAVVIAIVVALVVNSDLFLVENVVVNGGENVDTATAEQLLEVPEGTTLFNVDEETILSSLQRNPWVSGIEIERQWPDTLVITVQEYEVAFLAYFVTDDVAWFVSSGSTWIQPVAISAAVDEDGNAVEMLEDGSWPEGSTELTGEEAALAVATSYGVLLVTDVPSDADPSSGAAVESEEVLAALSYLEGFSSEFVATIKSLSVASVDSISAILQSGVEVALGDAEDISTKEQVITKLLEEYEGVTYINVREADAYTFRSTPTS